MSTVAQEIHLKSRPQGLPTKENFTFAEVSLPDLKEGEVLVKNLWMSVDPYMRGRMSDRKSYVPPFQIGAPLEGGAVGEVVDSKNEKFSVGDKVSSMKGWRSHFIDDGKGLQVLPDVPVPIQSFLGVLGMPGFTAYIGLTKIGKLKAKDNVFISAASGAVGGIACQIAKQMGCYVAGSVGSDEKARFLKEELGVDAVVNYRDTQDLQADMAKALPNGIDVYYENVGGEHLEASLNLMNDFGRIPVCGMIAQYNATEPTPGPSNLALIIMKRLLINGFIVFDSYDEYPDFVKVMSKWIIDKKIIGKETVAQGIENAPEAFLGLFSGKNMGKMLVKF